MIYFMLQLGCQHQVQQDSGTISTSQFPNYQYCSWSVTVSRGFVVSLTITSINIQSCDGNYMSIYDGVDDTAPMLVSLCGNNATSGTRLRSTGNIMFMTLRSGHDSQNMHFQADFTSTKPPSGMCILSLFNKAILARRFFSKIGNLFSSVTQLVVTGQRSLTKAFKP